MITLITSESNRIEYKCQLTDNLEKEVVAFLNYRDGGIIYIGIDDTGKIIGIEDTDSTQLKIKDRLKNNIAPSIMGLFDVIAEEQNNQAIIKVTIASGSEKPYYLKKKGMSEQGCFLRVGSASEPMPIQMIEDLFARRTRNSIGTIKSRKKGLTFEQLKIYYSETPLKLNDKFAHNLELLTEDGEFNYAAYLLSDNNGNSIKVAKYAGLNRATLVENEEYGYCSLIKATKAVLDKLRIENKTFARITSTIREERRLINPEALREAVINAIIHNNYTNEVPPKFEIFDDRLEITSAGGLPAGFDEEEFFMGYSVPPNKELMRIFKDLDMVEQLGSGIPRILEHYPRSIYHFTTNFIRLVFPYAEGFKHINLPITEQVKVNDKAISQVTGQATDQATDQAEILLKYCSIPRTSKEIMEHLNLTHRQHFRDAILHPLIASGKIKRTIPDKPSSPNQQYVVTGN